MAAPPAYLDECMDIALVRTLSERRYSVTTALLSGPAGASDEEQILYAARIGSVIITHNARHFGRWHLTFQSRGSEHSGIILIPDTGPISRLTIRTAMMLDWAG